AAPAARAAFTYTVTVGDPANSAVFFPPTQVIGVGDTVQWTWVSGSHSATSDTALWPAASSDFTFTFKDVGNFTYTDGPPTTDPLRMGSIRVVPRAFTVEVHDGFFNP